MARRQRRTRSATGSIASLLMVLVMVANPFGWRDALIHKAVARITERVEHRTQTVLENLGSLQQGQLTQPDMP